MLLAPKIRRLLLSGILCAVGCRTTIPLGWVNDVSSRRPRVLIVTEDDSSVVRVRNPSVAGDTIIGMVGGEAQRIPMSRVHRLYAVVADPVRTVALIGAIAAATAVVAIETSSPPSEECGGPQMGMNSDSGSGIC